VLPEIRQARVDHVAVGDDVLPDPMPRETLARLFALEIPVQFVDSRQKLPASAGFC